MVFLDKFLMFHMYMWFALVLGLQFQLSVVGHELTPQKDACPEVETPPDSNIKLHFLNVGGVERKCCGCNRGYYVTGLCSLDNKTDTICTRCKPGTYMDEYAHGEYRCKVDKLDACPADMILIPSQFDQAPRCECSSGFFKTTQGKCEDYSRCPPGEGVKTPGTPFQDTVCERCRSGYESPRSSAEERCRLKYELLPSNSRPTSTISETTSTFATSPPCNTSVTTGGVFLIAGLSVICTLVLVAVVYTCCRCCRCTSISKNKKKAFQEEDLEARNRTRVVNATTSLIGSSRESTLRSNFDSGVIMQFPNSKSIEIVEHVSGSPSAEATTNESVLFTGIRSPSSDDLNKKSTRQQISLYDSTTLDLLQEKDKSTAVDNNFLKSEREEEKKKESYRTKKTEKPKEIKQTTITKKIGPSGGRIALEDYNQCYVDIPQGAVAKPVNFKLTLLNETDQKPQTFIDNEWVDDEPILHGGKDYIVYTTKSFCWKRVRALHESSIKSKTLQFVGYRHPQNPDNWLVFRIKDEIDSPDKLKPGELFQGHFTLKSKETTLMAKLFHLIKFFISFTNREGKTLTMSITNEDNSNIIVDPQSYRFDIKFGETTFWEKNFIIKQNQEKNCVGLDQSKKLVEKLQYCIKYGNVIIEKGIFPPPWDMPKDDPTGNPHSKDRMTGQGCVKVEKNVDTLNVNISS